MASQRRRGNRWRSSLLGSAVALLLGTALGVTSTASQSPRFLAPEEYAVLDEMFRTHVNYFLSPEVITGFGFPMTAYKLGNRARFGYSNPTEWGYAWQAWIAAAERGLITRGEAVASLKHALGVLDQLQQEPSQSYHGFPYPFYKMTDPEGRDLFAPYRDPDPNIPSGDNALLYASLVIVEGWARRFGEEELWPIAARIRGRMDFRIFLRQEGRNLYIAHTLNAQTGILSKSNWDIYADEGGVVAWIAYLSESISLDEYAWLTDCQHRRPASWTSCGGEIYTVAEAAWFNAMFTWAVRSLAGFPIGDFDAPTGARSPYSRESLVPAAQTHLAYGDCWGVDHPAFSDAMSQAERGKGLVGWIQGWFVPPNLQDRVGWPPEHAVPHALFVPFNASPNLPDETRARLVAEILELKYDKAGYYHDAEPYPFGFEVIASPYADDLDYAGADDGRNVFETLSHAYIVLSLFNALQLSDGGPTFTSFAAEVPGYAEAVRTALRFLYPSPHAEPRTTVQQALEAADGAAVTLPPGVYREDLTITRPITLRGDDRERVCIVGDVSILGALAVTLTNLTISGGRISVEKGAVVNFRGVTVRDAGIDLKDESRATLIFCTVTGQRSGVSVTDSAELTMVACTVSGTSRWSGVGLHGSAKALLLGCHILDNQKHSIEISDRATATLRDNRIEGNGGYGIVSRSSGAVLGGGNHMRNNGCDLGGAVSGTLRVPLKEAQDWYTAFPDDGHASLQEAVDALLPGGSIRVGSGTHLGGLTIDKELYIEGATDEGSVLPVLEARNESAPVVSLVNGADLSVRGLKITGGSTGFTLGGDARAAIEDCAVSWSREAGVHVTNTATARLTECTISGNDDGFAIWDSAQVELINCTISHNRIGIYLTGTARGTMVDCTIAWNPVHGIWLSDRAQATISGCAISGTTYGDGVCVMESAQAVLVGNTVEDNAGYGIVSWSTGGVSGEDNRVRGNGVDLAGNLPGSLRLPLAESIEPEIVFPSERYASLQEALDALVPGGRLTILAGTHRARVTIGKEVEIVASEGAEVSLDADRGLLALSLVGGAKVMMKGIEISGGGRRGGSPGG